MQIQVTRGEEDLVHGNFPIGIYPSTVSPSEAVPQRLPRSTVSSCAGITLLTVSPEGRSVAPRVAPSRFEYQSPPIRVNQSRVTHSEGVLGQWIGSDTHRTWMPMDYL